MSTVRIYILGEIIIFDVPDGEHIPLGKARSYLLSTIDNDETGLIDIDNYVVNGDVTFFDLGNTTAVIPTTAEIKAYCGAGRTTDYMPLMANGYFPKDTNYIITGEETRYSGTWSRDWSLPIFRIRTINYVMDGKTVTRNATYPSITTIDDFFPNIDTYIDKECTIPFDKYLYDIDDETSWTMATRDTGNVRYNVDTVYCKFKPGVEHKLNDFVTINFQEREDLGRMIVLLKGKYSKWADVRITYENIHVSGYNPEVPIPIPQTSDNRVFEGWYYDEALTQKLSINDAIPDHDTTLYPKFIEDPNTKYWTLTVTEAGYPNRTYRVKDGDALPYQATISTDPKKYPVRSYIKSWGDNNKYVEIRSDTTLNLDDTDSFEWITVEDGYLFVDKDYNSGGSDYVKYDLATKEFIFPSNNKNYNLPTYEPTTFFAYDHDYNLVDYKVIVYVEVLFYKIKDDWSNDIYTNGFYEADGKEVTLQRAKDTISAVSPIESGMTLKFYDRQYDPVEKKVNYNPIDVFSNGSEIVKYKGYHNEQHRYYYKILPLPAHIMLAPNPAEVNNDVTLRVTEIIDVTLHSLYNESTEYAPLVKEVLSKYAETNDISLGRHKVGDTISLNFKDFAGNDIPIFNINNLKPPDKDLQSKIGINKLFMACMGVGLDIGYFNESLPVLITDAPGSGVKLNYGYFYLNLILNLNMADKTGRIIEYDEISYRIAGTAFETIFPNIDTSFVKTQDKQVAIPFLIVAESSGKWQSLPGYGIEIIVSAKGYQQFKQTFAVIDLLTSDDLNIFSVMTFIKSPIPIEIQMEPESYAISIVQETGGTISASTAMATMDTTVTLTATPETGYEFVSWNVSGPSGAISVSNNTFTMPAGNVSVTATFRLINYSITLAAVDNCTYEYSLDGSTYVAYTTNTTIEHGGEIYIKVVSADGYRFKSWSDGDTNNPRHLSNVVANTSLNAVLERDTVILTIRSMSSNNELIFVNETEYAGCGFTNPLQLEFEKGVTVYVGGKYQNGWGVDRITTYKDNVKINEVGGGGRNIDLGTNIVMDSNLEVHISWFCYD